mmetsp:Transcript_4253/g.4778  ORF Transcript_4253/g.4778 Transcript_4253/m.4778 type:complete len:123 (-) Transcript_4253:531-899(-)
MLHMLDILRSVELPCPFLSKISTSKAREFCKIYDAGQEESDEYRVLAQAALVLAGVQHKKRKKTQISSSEPLRKAIIKQFLVAKMTNRYSEALEEVPTTCHETFKATKEYIWPWRNKTLWNG